MKLMDAVVVFVLTAVMDGAVGVAPGINATEVLELGETTKLETACMMAVYDVPLVNPAETVMIPPETSVAVWNVAPLSMEYLYPVIDNPVDAPSLNDMATDVFPATTEVIVGELRSNATVDAETAVDPADEPNEVSAMTLKL